MSGFRKFLLRGNVVDLAVGIVIGAAFGAVVTSFVAAFVTPLVGWIGGANGDVSKATFTTHGVKFPYGAFVNAAVSFVLIAAVVYFFVVLPINRLMERFKPAPDEPALTKDCAECLSSIPAGAHKCAYCASPQAA